MPSGVYLRTPGLWAGNGGARRSHNKPALNIDQVLEARTMRVEGALCKTIAYKFNVSRQVVWHALNGTGTYAGF